MKNSSNSVSWIPYIFQSFWDHYLLVSSIVVKRTVTFQSLILGIGVLPAQCLESFRTFSFSSVLSTLLMIHLVVCSVFVLWPGYSICRFFMFYFFDGFLSSNLLLLTMLLLLLYPWNSFYLDTGPLRLLLSYLLFPIVHFSIILFLP